MLYFFHQSVPGSLTATVTSYVNAQSVRYLLQRTLVELVGIYTQCKLVELIDHSAILLNRYEGREIMLSLTTRYNQVIQLENYRAEIGINKGLWCLRRYETQNDPRTLRNMVCRGLYYSYPL